MHGCLVSVAHGWWYPLALYPPADLTNQYPVQAEMHLSFWSKCQIIAICSLPYDKASMGPMGTHKCANNMGGRTIGVCDGRQGEMDDQDEERLVVAWLGNVIGGGKKRHL